MTYTLVVAGLLWIYLTVDAAFQIEFLIRDTRQRRRRRYR